MVVLMYSAAFTLTAVWRAVLVRRHGRAQIQSCVPCVCVMKYTDDSSICHA